jgi:sarcosine oxidase
MHKIGGSIWAVQGGAAALCALPGREIRRWCRRGNTKYREATKMERRADLVVVGLGAVGSAVLYQLADRGIDAIGIDRFAPPHDKGSSHGESRITRLAVSEGPEYVAFARRSHELWRKIGDLSGRTLLEEVGAVFLSPAGKPIDSHGGHFVERALSVARRFGSDHERLGEAALAQRFPQFRISGPMLGYYEKTGGFVRPEACVEAQLLLARRAGAATEFGVVAEDLVQETDGVRVITDRGDFRARRVVVAAGAWLPKLIGGAFAQLKVSRQILFWFTVIDPDLWDKKRCPIFIWANRMRPEDLFYGFPMAGPELRIKSPAKPGWPIRMTSPRSRRSARPKRRRSTGRMLRLA